MRKWISRTAGTVLIGAAFTAAGTGIANADSMGANHNVWDTLLSQAAGPPNNVCNDIAEPTSRINTTGCDALPRGDDDTPPATTNQAPPTDQRPADQQQAAPQPSDQGSGGLGNGDVPLLGGALKGLGG